MKRLTAWGLVLTMALGLVVAPVAFAQETAAQATGLQTDLTMVPSKTVLRLAPGETYTGTIQIAAARDQNLLAALEIKDFRADPERDGVPLFYDVGEADEGQPGLSRWMSLSEQQVALEPQTFSEVELTIAIPRNANPGGYYGAVLMNLPTALSEDAANASAIDAYVAGLYLVEVSGALVEQGALSSFGMTRWWYPQPPAVARLTFDNKGNTHLAPTGVVEILNEWGKRVHEEPLNPNQALVLPSSNRTFETSWGQNQAWQVGPLRLAWGSPLAMGLYRARATVWYGSTGQVSQAEDWFVMLPIAWLLGAALSALALWLIGRWWLKRYQLRVLADRPLQFGESGSAASPPTDESR